jgi:hypothetical protein
MPSTARQLIGIEEELAKIVRLLDARDRGSSHEGPPVILSVRSQNASTRRAASTTRSTDGMYQSSSCQ